jgi:four helix bundle protein
MDLVDFVYDLTDRFPAKEKRRLASQLIRSVSSAPANIAEGQARATSRDFAHFLIVARASLMEADTHTEIALRRRYVTPVEAKAVLDKIDEISRMIIGLRNKVVQRKRTS